MSAARAGSPATAWLPLYLLIWSLHVLRIKIKRFLHQARLNCAVKHEHHLCIHWSFFFPPFNDLFLKFCDFWAVVIIEVMIFVMNAMLWREEKGKPEACLWKDVHFSSPFDCSYTLEGLFCLMAPNQPSSPTIPISVFQLLLSGDNHLVMNSLISSLLYSSAFFVRLFLDKPALVCVKRGRGNVFYFYFFIYKVWKVRLNEWQS